MSLIINLSMLESELITDTLTDSRIGTCYVKDNAELIINALNFFERSKPSVSRRY
jgi:hypothetical protein